MSTLTVTYYTTRDLPAIEETLISVYAEVYQVEAAADPFFSVERYTERLHSHASAPRWGCALGDVEGEPVGYAYGFGYTAASRWRDLLTEVPAEELVETDNRTFALCEIMVRAPWRRTGIARALHDELLARRSEERSSLLVDQEHPRVRALYESWGYRWMGVMQPFPDSPRYDAMLRPLT